jgi:hypothetical protein
MGKRKQTGFMGRLVFLLLAFPLTANAFQFQITWTAPNTRTDGTALPPDEIGHYDLYADGALLQAVPAGESSIQISMTPGNHCFEMKTVDTDGRESDFSNEACKVLPSAAPPNALTIDVIIVQ